LSSLKAVTFLSFIEKIMSFKVTKTWGSKSNRSCRLQSSGKETESVQDIERLELSFSRYDDSFDQGGKRNVHQTPKDVCQDGKSMKKRICKEFTNGQNFCM